MQTFHDLVPYRSIKLLQYWIDELDVKVVLSLPRKTKLGDFKVRHNRFVVSINNNLNPYSFLITLTHELAHAFVYKEYKKKVIPHGKSWQKTFKSLMLNFLTPDYFPEDILRVLSRHMLSPKASTYSDLELIKVLKKHDEIKSFTISDISEGEIFNTSNGRAFVKGQLLRKRYKCFECKTNKVYMFHPYAEVIRRQ